jgi:hypothetical protein
MLPKRAACQLEICRCSDGATALTLGLGASVQPIEKESFPSKESEPGKPVLRCFASPLQGAAPADQPNSECSAVAAQYGVPSLCAARRWSSIVTTAMSSSG